MSKMVNNRIRPRKNTSLNSLFQDKQCEDDTAICSDNNEILKDDTPIHSDSNEVLDNDDTIQEFNDMQIPVIQDDCKMGTKRKHKGQKKESVETPVISSCSQKHKPYNLYRKLINENEFIKINGRIHAYIQEYGYFADIEQIDGTIFLRNLFNEKDKPYINQNILYEIVDWLKAELEEKDKSELDNNWKYLNFKDKVYSIEDGDLLDHSPEYCFLSYLNAYAPDTLHIPESVIKDSYFYDYLKSTFKGKKNSETIFQEALGVAISSIRNMKKSIFLFGPSNSGKSIALNIFSMLVGEKFTSSVSFSQLGEDFAVALLPGKTLNVSGETSGIGNKRLDIYKSATGNDKITACRKGKDHFQFVNRALFVFGCNELPMIDMELPEPVIERMQIIPFSNAVSKENQIMNLMDRLENEKEIIVVYAIKGLLRYIKNGYAFSQDDTTKQIVDSYIESVNNFIIFAKKYVIRDKKAKVTSKQISDAYEDYCRKQDLFPVSNNQRFRILKNTYGAISTRITGEEGIPYNARGYKGIRLTYYDINDDMEEFSNE